MTAGSNLSFAIVLRRYRTARGLTQDELAERAGISARSVSDLERGISRSPHRDTLALLAQALELTSEESAIFMGTARVARVTPESETPPDDLPEPLNPILGREREEKEAILLVEQSGVRLLTLTGPAGVGKTRLSLHLARQLTSGFPEGARFIDLSAVRDPDRVLPAIALALDLREQGQQSLTDVLLATLHDQRRLLVLDNFEQVLPGAGQIARLLGECPHLSVIVTSRAPLRVPFERELNVPPLAVPDPRRLPTFEHLPTYAAIALFLARAQSAKPDFSPTAAQATAIAKICARLDGLPLAIELAAARIRVLTPQALLTQISGSTGRSLLQMLTGGARDLPTRQQTMHDALLWSYSLLDAREQVLFRRLSVFVDGFTLESAEAIGAVTGLDVLEGLADLVDKSLVRQETMPDGTPRFRLFEVMREFGLSLLSARKEESALRRQHAEYFAGWVTRSERELTGSLQPQTLANFAREYENIRAAMRWAREQQEVAIAMQLAGSLWWFWENRGYLSEGREWLDGVLALRRDGVPPEILTRVLYGATILATRQGDFQRARALAWESLASDFDPARRARVLSILGNIAKFQGDYAEASRYLEESITILRESGDVKGLIVALNNLGTIAIELGQTSRAETLLEESLTLKRQVDDRRGIAVGLLNLSELAKTQGHLDRARALLAEALGVFHELSDQQGIAMSLNNMGEIARAQGDFTAAVDDFADTLTRFRQIADLHGQALVRHNLALTYVMMGQAGRAAPLLVESLSTYETMDNQVGLRQCVLLLAAVACADGRPQAAARLLGLVDVLAMPTGPQLTADEETISVATSASVRELLGEAAFADESMVGRTLSIAAAIALATPSA